VKNFSIFESALRASALEQTQNLLQIVNLRRSDFDGRESFLCRTTSASVEYACLMIEHALLIKPNRSGRVYAGFEKLSSLQPIVDRYLRIADLSDVVYLFGVDDWQPRRHPNIRIIPLEPSFRLARETFLITQSSTLKRAFVARNKGTDEHLKAGSPTCWAFKSSNPRIVTDLSNAIEGVIDWALVA
jgi:DICT domain-containing protein